MPHAISQPKFSEVIQLENVVQRHLENPFLVLELSCRSDAAESERAGQKLLSMLAAELEQAQTYPTPIGRRPRTAELVRTAMAELRDGERRLLHEWWAMGWGMAP